MRAALGNRFVVLGMLLAVGVALWNVYVWAHAHGIVTGRVVDQTGQPVAGATVLLFQRDFVSQQERGRTLSDSAGRFHFNTNASHVVQLEAQHGAARSPRITIRLWFRGEDVVLETPLRLGGTA